MDDLDDSLSMMKPSLKKTIDELQNSQKSIRSMHTALSSIAACYEDAEKKNVSNSLIVKISEIAGSILPAAGEAQANGWKDNTYKYKMSDGSSISFHEGPPKRPRWEVYKDYDNDFPYDPNAKPTISDRADWVKWGIISGGAGLINHLPDGVAAYEHYRNGNGTPLEIDYKKAYQEDAGVRKSVDHYVNETNKAIAEMIANGKKPPFSITSELVNSTHYPETENWQKAIGAHKMWISADVTVDSNGNVVVAATVHELDRYNFNKGMEDIATGTSDNVNGRFETLGWAHSFDTYGSVQITSTLGDTVEIVTPGTTTSSR